MPEHQFKKLISDTKNLIRILDNLKEGIIAHDLNRRIFFFNHEAERITGYSREEALNRDCHETFGAPFCGERCLFADRREDAHLHLTDRLEYPVNILTRDGESRKVEMSVNPLRDENGEIFGVMAMLRDMTDFLKFQMKSGEMTGFGDIIGRDHQMLQVFQQIRDLSSYDFPVHVYGETGTGKELVAEAIHEESRRGGGPFVPINCGALPEGLIESELFGHVKGAFTGAIRDKKGRFELAHGGTIFLDEVAELPRDLQVKLLRFLQTGKFDRVGGEKTVSVDVRIISATNKDLKNEVRKETFREDLFYRLNVIPIHLPPLRDRRNDIPLLIQHFLHQFGIDHDHKTQLAVSREALSQMMDYDWPGNVRQLQNALQFAIVKCNGKLILPADLPMELREVVCRPRRGPNKKLDYDSVRAALEKTGGNKVKAAKLLGVGRATLYRFINEHPETVPEIL